jgi:hypothetical protein
VSFQESARRHGGMAERHDNLGTTISLTPDHPAAIPPSRHSAVNGENMRPYPDRGKMPKLNRTLANDSVHLLPCTLHPVPCTC